jgi:ribosomal protein S18 acetylase RimI-like enzyme
LEPNVQQRAEEAMAANLVAHMSWVQRRVEGMHVQDDGALVIVDSGLPCDTFNVVCRARLSADSLEARVAAVIGHFRAVARPFSWWVGPGDRPSGLAAALGAAGLKADEESLGMAADLSALDQQADLPHGLRIERVRTVEQLGQFAAINAANWMPPDPHVIRFYELAALVLLEADAPLWLYVGYLDDWPVAAAELTVAGGVVGLYGISTLREYRRRGIGGAMTQQPLLDAKAAGYRVAVLQASPEGTRVYERIGFQPMGHFVEFKPLSGEIDRSAYSSSV